ncbi:MAG: aminoacyl-histidine dipeptidase [Candidatus Eremiobacteraeota bacterium]|nr:aminoacyl-histidine dipeptidase [Candidatus Eremiobacteraeota bacterium]
MQIQELEPQALWRNFADLNAVPRASKKEERVIAFMQKFAQGLSLETQTDEVGNVLVRKPASAGLEGHPTVALQSHLDMVHQKNAKTEFDFATQGIDMVVEEDWVRARGTTLGADNGIGVAAIMALLASDEVAHPPLEALFTIDEETGMTGAKGLKPGWLEARYMLNLDTEDDRELTIGCAGGVDIVGQGSYATEAAPEGHQFWRLEVSGLTGGHSGMDIHLGRANANKLMNRLLFEATARGARLASLDGGGLRNAIPRESVAIVAAPSGDFPAYLQELGDTIRAEFASTDPDFAWSCQTVEQVVPVLEQDFADRLLRVIYAIPDGIYRLSPEVEGLVQTSNNLARVEVTDGRYSLACLSRGSVDSEKMDLARAISCSLELLGAEVKTSGAYPGWAPAPEAKVVKVMRETYLEMFGHEPHVNACHAGLECGIIGKNYPEMEMISFGPNIRGAHSPDERVQISSVQKFWQLLLKTLTRL